MKEKNYIFQISADIYLLLLPQLTILHKKTNTYMISKKHPIPLSLRIDSLITEEKNTYMSN